VYTWLSKLEDWTKPPMARVQRGDEQRPLLSTKRTEMERLLEASDGHASPGGGVAVQKELT
jgi:hypothetical protein